MLICHIYKRLKIFYVSESTFGMSYSAFRMASVIQYIYKYASWDFSDEVDSETCLDNLFWQWNNV